MAKAAHAEDASIYILQSRAVMDKAAMERDDRSLKNSVKTMPSLSDAWRMPPPALLQQYGKVRHEPEDAPISDGPDIGVRLHTCTHPGLAAATDDLKRMEEPENVRKERDKANGERSVPGKWSDQFNKERIRWRSAPAGRFPSNLAQMDLERWILTCSGA